MEDPKKEIKRTVWSMRMRNGASRRNNVLPNRNVPRGLLRGVAKIDPVMDTVLVAGNPEPRATQGSITTTKVTTVLKTLSATSQLLASDIAANLPTGTYTFRVLKASFYGPSDDITDIKVADLTSDESEFIDFGTAGAQRSQVHIRPSFQVRNTWYGSAAVTPLYDVNTLNSATGLQFVANLTVEVRYR
jgi:hypothetical protein